MSLRKRIGLYIISVLLAALLAISATLAYAYFSNKTVYDGYLSGQVELLFDRLNDEGLAAYSTAEGVTANKDKEWGTKENPYVISNIRHLYNLSELQRLGYFYKKYISKNTDSDFSNIPYFLICTPDYTPVLIDGSKQKISSIGNEKYPFIGSVKGVTGTAVSFEGKSSETSVLHNITVNSNPNSPDAGLFGYVGFLGTPPDDQASDATFVGMPSVISNMVLSDVTVKVDYNLWDRIIAFLADIATGSGHRYSFTPLYGTENYDQVLHENHHIGILAGHVSYSMVQYISVFYSDDDVAAIDLTDLNAVEGVESNYMSCAGILGFIYNLNPNFDDVSGKLEANSGTSVADISYTMVGGGGAKPGSLAGYVLAKNIYESYKYIGGTPENDGEADTTGTINIKDAQLPDGTPLCDEFVSVINWGSQNSGKYYFYDGVFTFALSSSDTSQKQDVIEPTWEDEEAPEFHLGSTDRADWVNNYTQGVYAVAAYLSKISSDYELQQAINAGMPLVIMREVDAVNYMMSLYEATLPDESSGFIQSSFSEKYSTNAAGLQYGDEDFINSIIQASKGDDIESFIGNFEAYGNGVDKNEKLFEIMDAIENGNDGKTWRVINVSKESGDFSIETLRSQYKINGTKLEGKSAYYNTDGEPLIVKDGQIYDYYDYTANENYSGYFYYTEEKIDYIISQRTVYSYYWKSEDGTVTTLREGSLFNTTSPSSYFSNVTGSWEGENIYTKDGRVGAVVNMTTGKFYSSGNTANANGIYLFKPSSEVVKFFHKPVGEEGYYYSEGGGPYDFSEFRATSETTIAGDVIYELIADTSKKGILVDSYQTYSFSAIDKDQNTNYLRMIRAEFSGIGTHYTLWNGTDAQRDSYSNFKHGTTSLNIKNPTKVTDSIEAVVKFNNDDNGTCYIQYSIDSVVQFVSFNGNTSSPGFNTSLSNTESNTALCIFALEGTHAVDYGYVTFDPEEIDEDLTFSADTHVLYATNDSSGNTSYELFALSDLPNLGSEKLGWNNGNSASNGGALTATDLHKKFRMMYGIDFALSLGIGSTPLNTPGLITVPVGSTGVQTTIPMGCIAFKVNKTGEQHIRVIVSVATSEYAIGEVDPNTGKEINTLSQYKSYFSIWEMPEFSGTGLSFSMFRKNNYVERFEIPISHPYDRRSNSLSENSASGFYNNISYTKDGTKGTYGLYMNGDRLLVAYEFTVTEPGIYVMGTCADLNDVEVPMEIIYFAVDGTASTGRDGASDSQLGTLDFVYENEGKIVTVTDSSSTDADGQEDYSTYYPSYCLLYFQGFVTTSEGNEFMVVNEELVHVRRHIDTGEDPPTSTDGYKTTTSKSIISLILGRDKYTNIVQYSRVADNVHKEEQ